TRHVAEHPLVDGTEGVMAERIHARIVDKPLFFGIAVPSLPDRCSAIGNLKSQRWIVCTQYQLISHIGTACCRECRQQGPEPQESGSELIPVSFHQLTEPAASFPLARRIQQLHINGVCVCRLRISIEPQMPI